MPARPHSIRFSLEYDTDRLAETVAASLDNEVGEINDDRSRTTLSRERSTVCIDVEAADLVALRAASNTWLSLADVAERTVQAAE